MCPILIGRYNNYHCNNAEDKMGLHHARRMGQQSSLASVKISVTLSRFCYRFIVSISNDFLGNNFI